MSLSDNSCFSRFAQKDFKITFVENGAVAIEGTKIAAVGETEAIKKHSDYQQIIIKTFFLPL